MPLNLSTLPASEAERLAYAEGFTMTAELFARIAELEAEVDRLQNELEDTATLAEWEDKNGPAYDYVQFFNECFERLAGHYPTPSITSDYDKNVIFNAIEKGGRRMKTETSELTGAALDCNDNNVRTWTVSVWDGNSTYKFQRRGTYEQVANSLAGYPPAYIWSIQ